MCGWIFVTTRYEQVTHSASALTLQGSLSSFNHWHYCNTDNCPAAPGYNACRAFITNIMSRGTTWAPIDRPCSSPSYTFGAAWGFRKSPSDRLHFSRLAVPIDRWTQTPNFSFRNGRRLVPNDFANTPSKSFQQVSHQRVRVYFSNVQFPIERFFCEKKEREIFTLLS